MSNLEFFQFACLSDNYGVLVHDPDSGRTASIDAPDAAAVREALSSQGWKLTDILVTHHHWDHTQGIEDLKSETGCRVAGPAGEADKIAHMDETFSEGETFSFGSDSVTVIETPGHTLGMINFHFTKSGVVFTGDTLFALGCGRVFEGTKPMMWESLQKLAQLPPETMIYCGHEYTKANAEFALTIDPENDALHSRVEEITRLRAARESTLPTRLSDELSTNPFLRANDPGIRKHLGMETASDAEVFTEIRTRKDNG